MVVSEVEVGAEDLAFVGAAFAGVAEVSITTTGARRRHMAVLEAQVVTEGAIKEIGVLHGVAEGEDFVGAAGAEDLEGRAAEAAINVVDLAADTIAADINPIRKHNWKEINKKQKYSFIKSWFRGLELLQRWLLQTLLGR